MSLTFYYDLLSQPCRTVYILLKANKISFEGKEISLQKGEHKSDQYKKINPFCTVPLIDDAGFVLTESVAIAKYILGQNSLPGHWYPKDVKKQARVEEYLRWYPSTTRSSCVDLFLELAVFPMIFKRPSDQEKVKDYRGKVTAMVGHLETYFLKDKKFVAGDEISIADLFGVCELVQLYGCHEQGLYESSAVVKGWVDRVKQETNPHFDESMKVVNHIHTMFAESSKK